MFVRILCLVAIALVTATTSTLAADPGRGMVASVHPLATDAGIAALQKGGNAVDAAVATALTLGVVDTHNSGIGGGCFILIRVPAKGPDEPARLIAIDGRETAPAAATADMYLRNGKADPKQSTLGPLAVGVPGALAAYEMAIQDAGNLALADLLSPAADIAENGFRLDRVYARNLNAKARDLARFAGSKAIFLKADGQPYREGETLKQADLAATYRAIASHGTDWFYEGPFAKRVGGWMQNHGGILAADDFAAYNAVRREPIVTTYRDWKVVGFPPPSSGGVHVAQMLNILESFDIAAVHRNDPNQAAHVIAEAMKLAFADRAHWLGDADFVDVPKGLINKAYAQSLAKGIQRDRSTNVAGHGEPADFEAGKFGRHTTHIAAADEEGYWVAITATINTHYGSKVVVPGTGVVLNNEMDDFSAQPGVPNAFGLVGAANNAIAPGKRPLSSMSPTIVLDQRGQPVMTIGAAGGPKIITQVLLGIIRHLEYGHTLRESVTAPRFHHQWRPDQLYIEATNDKSFIKAMKDVGHTVKTIEAAGVTQAIARDAQGRLQGVSDPRVLGKVGATTD